MNLTEIKAAVEKEYVALPIEFTESDDADAKVHTLKLRNVMRLSDEEQQKVEALGARFEEQQSVSGARPLFREYLEVLSGDVKMTDKFLKVIGDDLAIILYVVNEYQSVTQAEKA